MYRWKEIITHISLALKRKKWMIPVPATAVKLIALLLDRFKFFPITRDQLTMLLEGNTCDSKNLFSEFDIQPIDFNNRNLSYLRQK